MALNAYRQCELASGTCRVWSTRVKLIPEMISTPFALTISSQKAKRLPLKFYESTPELLSVPIEKLGIPLH